MSARLLAFVLFAVPVPAFAFGTTTFSFSGGAGSWESTSGEGSFTTFSARVGKLTARNRPVQMELYFGYRTEMAGGHDFQELDFGVGGRVLPQRPLFYTKNTAIRPTASASIGWSLASFDLPMETSAGLAICDNTGKFTGIMVELVARPTNETLAKQSNTVADKGKPGVVDMGPWVGGRLMVFW